MSAPLVDEEARRLVTDDGLDQTLFVEAGAGTGKTTQLVRRLVNLVIREGVPVHEIAAITFTEAAAAELRQRIREAFELEDDPDSEVQARCAAALAEVDLAALSTLHAFALRVLSEHSIQAGLPPQVEVLDEVSSRLAFEERWRDFVDRLHGDPDLQPVVVRARLVGAALSSNYGNSVKDVALHFAQNWDRLEGLDVPRGPLEPVELGPLRPLLTEVLGLPGRCHRDEDLLACHIEEIRPEIERILDADDPDEVLGLLALKTTWKCSNGRGPDWDDLDGAQDTLKRADAERERLLQRLTDDVLDRLAPELVDLTLDAAEARRAEGQLEFHDLLVLARRLLRASHPAREALHQRYTRLLLDEFQDTDPIQVELALLIASTVAGQVDDAWEDERVLPADGRLFFVGDPKQSIYRFRRADISVVMRSRKRFAPGGPVQLRQNFRSVPPVVEFVNGVFERLIGDGSGEGQPPYESLVPHRAGAPEADHRVVLMGQGRDDLKADPLRQEEARDVARAIHAIRSDPDAWPVWDEVAHAWRPPELDDIAVLLPTRTSLRFLEAALRAMDIPYRADTGSLVYDTQEVREVLAVLQAVADPTDQIALVTALRSPLFACGDDDLFTWYAAGGRWDLRRDAPEGVPAGHPVASAIAYLHQLYEVRWWTAPSQLLDRVIRERRVQELAFAQRRARDVWRRLRYVVDQARVFEAAQGTDLRAYLSWAELQRLDAVRAHEPLLPEADDRSVRLLTVHGAKGLEFPIVICTGMTTEPRSRSGVAIWGDNGLPEIRLSAKVHTDDFDRLADLENEMDDHERVRLLYVALTRARDHLFVSTHHVLGKDSYGGRLWGIAGGWLDDGQCRALNEVAPPIDGQAEAPTQVPLKAPDAPVPNPEREAWIAARQRLLDVAGASRVISATGVATLDDAGEPPADDEDEEAAGEEEFTPPWRRGRAGSAIGRAVHASLQVIDLRTGDGLAEVAAAEAQSESVPGVADQVVDMARSALASTAVIRALASDRYWRELYVAAPVDHVTLEGYVDLLFEEDGQLVVVDYKTDSVPSEAEVDAKLDRYRLQAAAYAVALERSTGKTVKECSFVFCKKSGAIERTVADLDAAKAEVRERLSS